MSIVINLDVMMAKRKIGLTELSKEVDITMANLSILKNNKAKAVRFSTLNAICKALNCQPGDILEYVEDEEEMMCIRDRPRKVIVPGKTLIEVSKILSGEMDALVNLFFTKNHIVFEFDETTVVSRLIEGEYFRIEQMLSTDYETKVKVNKKELLSCIDRATLLIRENDKKPIIIQITDGEMRLKLTSGLGTMPMNTRR